MKPLDPFEITGRSRTHVEQVGAPRFAAQDEVAAAFLTMRSAAAKDGIDLFPVSSFRDYRMQLRIWNQKFSGKAPLYDMEGKARDYASLRGEEEVIRSILNWSALPGGSRHQWGTDIDVVDRAAAPPGYVAQLLPQEVAPGGIFRELHRWLDANIHRFGFFRPYNYYVGGMYPEPWHLSYAPIAMEVVKQIDIELLRETTLAAGMQGKVATVKMLAEIVNGHILNFVGPDRQRPVIG